LSIGKKSIISFQRVKSADLEVFDSPAAFAWMAASAALFATMNFFVRLATAHLAWQLVGTTRALVGALVAILVAVSRGSSLRVKDQRAMWVRSAFGTASMACTFWALSMRGLSLGDTATLLYLSPLMIAFLGPVMLKERAGRGLIVALLVAGAGVFLVLRPAILFGGDALGAGSMKTAVLAVLAATFSAFAMIALRRVGPHESAEAVSAHFSLTATAVFAVLSIPYLSMPSAKDALYMLLAGLSAGLAQLSMTRAYSLARAARVASIGYLTVVVSAIYGAAALGEWPHPLALFGMALVICGGLITALPALRTARIRRL
jgi:drug/metabolite transporter (DMT)-like permease